VLHWLKLGIWDYPLSKPVQKRVQQGYETYHSAYGPVIICNHKQGHYSDRRICEMITLIKEMITLNAIRYYSAT
jgi:hypothetical protein